MKWNWLQWLSIMLVGAALVFLVIFAVHSAYAAPRSDGGMKIIPRGPGGPPVVILDDDAGPRWKIVVTMEGPPGKQELAYGNKEDGIHWYATLDECKKAIKSDPKLGHGLKLLHEQVKQTKMPIEVTVECRPDNSV